MVRRKVTFLRPQIVGDDAENRTLESFNLSPAFSPLYHKFVGWMTMFLYLCKAVRLWGLVTPHFHPIFCLTFQTWWAQTCILWRSQGDDMITKERYYFFIALTHFYPFLVLTLRFLCSQVVQEHTVVWNLSPSHVGKGIRDLGLCFWKPLDYKRWLKQGKFA